MARVFGTNRTNSRHSSLGPEPYSVIQRVIHSVYQPDYGNQMLPSNQQMPAISHQTPYSMTMESVSGESLSVATTSPHDTYKEHGNGWISSYDITAPEVEEFSSVWNIMIWNHLHRLTKPTNIS